MKYIDFIKDHQITYIIIGLSHLFIIFLLNAFKLPLQGIVIYTIVSFVTFFTLSIYEYQKTTKFVKDLNAHIELLDQKYLVLETIESPTRQIDQVVYNALFEINQSYIDHLAYHLSNQKEFKEYVELWIHEVKLPLASLMLKSHNDKDHKYYDQLKRLDQNIDQILYLVKSEYAKDDLVIKAVSLKEVVKKVILNNKDDLLDLNFEIETNIADVNVYSDAKWLAFIINQVLSNAIKYRSNNPKITLLTEVEQDKIVLHIKDNGIGIYSYDLPKVFNKSYTGENGRDSTKSTGYGLYITKKLCNQLGHQITIDSIVDQYTDVSVIFGINNLYHADM